MREAEQSELFKKDANCQSEKMTRGNCALTTHMLFFACPLCHA